MYSYNSYLCALLFSFSPAAHSFSEKIFVKDASQSRLCTYHACVRGSETQSVSVCYTGISTLKVTVHCKKKLSFQTCQFNLTCFLSCYSNCIVLL